MAGVDISGLDERILNCEVVILCDVDNKLLGPTGAATVFGPQKGASPGDVYVLDNFLANFAKTTLTHTGTDLSATKHGGTAGGAAAGLHAWINAKLVNGTGYFLSVTKFEEVLKGSNLVITGEGSIDHQTLGGKGPFGIAVRAKALNIPVIGIAGKIPLEPDVDLNDYFDVLIAIGNEPSAIDAALENTTLNLIRTATMAGNLIAVRNMK